MGEVFAGRYELVDPIGRGGVGEIWRAWDHRRRRYVAAKVLQQRDAHSLLRFVREQALRIDHPYVLAPTSWAADDDKVLFTMDLVRGGSLAHLIGDYGALPPRLVVTLLDQLLAGLTAVHAEGVVHRDIKPANLLLEATGTGQPHLRLSDFGIAVRTGDPRLTETNYVVGTPGYFAPEQMLGADPDFPQDLYAVGLVALFMLTGRKPDSEALVDSYASGGFPSAPEAVPHALWQVVASLLNPDPQARFRTATGVRKALSGAREVLPDPFPDDETVEVFDHLGPLPEGFGPDGPLRTAGGVREGRPAPGPGNGNGSAPGGEGTPGGSGGGPGTVRLQGEGTLPPQPSMSETGSFVLAPPEPQAPASAPDSVSPYRHPGTPPLADSPRTPPTPTPVAGPAQAAASPPALPGPPPHPGNPAGDPAGGPAGRGSQRRPGPSAKVVVPVLILAVLCFAVGVWALATS